MSTASGLPPAKGEWLDVENPGNGDLLARVPLSTADDNVPW